ncbi:RCC1 and BTB domain-containing protein 1 [Anthophora quadrimaculata]
MFPSVLRYWPIFSSLDLKFISEIRMTFVYGNSGDGALIVTKDGMVYRLGKNISKQFGTDDTDGTLHPKEIDELCEKGIKTFAYGRSPHCLALTEEGEIYAWSCDIPASIPTKLKFTGRQKIVQIACANDYSLALMDDGQMYMLEKYLNQLDKYSYMKVKLTLSGTKVVSISCGHAFNLAVTDNGNIYSWGRNEYGTLGIGNYEDKLSPCKVKSLTGVLIEKVACGMHHVLALSDEGVVYVWGCNSFGQLGCAKESHICNPQKLEVPEMRKVIDIAATNSNHMSTAMDVGNRIYIWGHCRGLYIYVPTVTPLRCLHDAFACYGNPTVMHQPLILHDDDETNLTSSLRKAFDDATTSDFTIQVQGKSIHVHKALLKMRSLYFNAMFEKHWAENNKSVIEHEQFSYNTYKIFLKYLYTDEIDTPNDIEGKYYYLLHCRESIIYKVLLFIELTNLADAYLDSQLKRRCVQLMKKSLTITDVALFYSLSIKFNAKDLTKCCLVFALNHMTEVIKTPNFAKLDGSTTKMFIIEAAEAGAFKT